MERRSKVLASSGAIGHGALLLGKKNAIRQSHRHLACGDRDRSVVITVDHVGNSLRGNFPYAKAIYQQKQNIGAFAWEFLLPMNCSPCLFRTVDPGAVTACGIQGLRIPFKGKTGSGWRQTRT